MNQLFWSLGRPWLWVHLFAPLQKGGGVGSMVCQFEGNKDMETDKSVARSSQSLHPEGEDRGDLYAPGGRRRNSDEGRDRGTHPHDGLLRMGYVIPLHHRPRQSVSSPNGRARQTPGTPVPKRSDNHIVRSSNMASAIAGLPIRQARQNGCTP